MCRLLAFVPLCIGCSTDHPPDVAAPETNKRFAVEVIAFEPGDGAGFGQADMPSIVLGPPDGGVETAGGTHVVSLGLSGSIVVRMGDEIVDVDGPDFIVFENPFKIAGTATIFAEPGAVSVSDDGEAFTDFPCAPDDAPPNGCAGFSLVRAGSGNELDPNVVDEAGGDVFDLATIGVASARFVRIVDVGPARGGEPLVGFDLDAVSIVNVAAP